MGFDFEYAKNTILKEFGDKVSFDLKRKPLLKFGLVNAPTPNKYTVMEFLGTETQETYATSNSIDSIVSDGLTNNQFIRVEGHTLSPVGLTFLVQDVQLNGQTPVLLETPLARVSRILVLGAVPLQLNTAVYIYESLGVIVSGGVPDTPSKVHIIAKYLANRSQKCSTSISHQDYYAITSVFAALETRKAVKCIMRLESRSLDNIFLPYFDWDVAATSSGAVIELTPPIIIPKNSDVFISCEPDDVGSVVSAWFNGYFGIIEEFTK